MKPDLSKPLFRDFAIRAESVNVDARTVELAFASEAPVERWFGSEILDMAPKAVRLARLNDGGALLVNHDSADQVGVVESARVDKDRTARAVVRFSRSARGEEIFQDVQDGIRRLVSVGYRIHDLQLVKSGDGGDGGDVYRALDWEPYEISLVPVPADASVGVGRSIASTPSTVGEEPSMTTTPEQIQPGDAQARSQATTPTLVAMPSAHDGVEAERARAREIRALGKQFQLTDDAERAIDNGWTADAFKDSLLATLKQRGTLRPAESPEIGMSPREVEQFSFLRALLAASDPVNAHKLAPFEYEASRAAQDRRGDSRPKEREAAITIPVDVLSRGLSFDAQAGAAALRMLAKRDLSVGTATAGGHLVATDLLGGSFIDLLRNAMVLDRMGMTMLTDLNGNVAIPRQTGAATGYWVAEAGTPTESQQAVDQVTLSPKTLGAFTDYGRRLLLQSSVDVELFVRADLAAIIGQAIQLAAINGSGASNQPTGVLNTSGIGSVAGGTNGAAPTYAHMVALESAVANANAAAGNLAFLTNTKVRGKLRTTEEFATTNGRPVWTSGQGMDGSVLGYSAVVTNSVPSDLTKGTASAVCSAILFGNWADLLIGLWGGLDLMVDPYALATSGGRRLIALQDLDIAVRHPESFAAMKDALTA